MVSRYKRFYLNNNYTRWINVDDLGNKDKIKLKTALGNTVERVCQYWGKFFAGEGKELVDKCKITYKGKTYFVTRDSILED